MDSKPANDVTPGTPPDDNVSPGVRTPAARTLPRTPPFSPSQQQQSAQPQRTSDPIIERVESVIAWYSRRDILESDQRSGFELSLTQLDDLERGLQNKKPPLWSLQEYQLCYDFEAPD